MGPEKKFKRDKSQTAKLGTVLLVWSLFALFDVFILFSGTSEAEFLELLDLYNDEFIIELVTDILAVIITLWILLWPVRIMAKFLSEEEDIAGKRVNPGECFEE